MSLSPAQLSQHVAKALERAGGPAVLAYAWTSGWNNGEALKVGDRAIPVRVCSSPLAVREALLDGAEESRVLLVSAPETDLESDVLARLFSHKLMHVDRWQVVADAYGANQIDPRLYKIPWIADALLDTAPRQRPQSLTVLTYDHALIACIERVLGLRTFDLRSLLQCFESSATAWTALPADQRDVYQRYLTDSLGPAVEGIAGAVASGNASAIVGIGLACEVLFGVSDQNQIRLRDARIRLESHLNACRLSDSAGLSWAQAAKRLVMAREEGARQSAFRIAVDLLEKLGAEDYLGASTVLPEALDRRLDELATSVHAFLRNPHDLADVEHAAERVAAHELPPRDHPGRATADMVVRLCRRQASLVTSGKTAFGIEEYRQHGAWEDWARRTLRFVRPSSLSQAVSKLLGRVADRRAESDRRFAEQVARQAADGGLPPGVLAVESAMSQIVGPLADSGPVLLLVLDGMSWDVYLSIARELEHAGWSAWKKAGAMTSLLATTPSVTECSRASLLAGRLMRGTASHEKQAFEANDGLRQRSRRNKPPVLLHKGDIQQGNQLSARVSELLGDPEQLVVGIVINAIDDALAKSEQIRIDWSIEAIPLLGAILDQARAAHRTVVITSDHGHVLESNSEYRNTGTGERWRSADGEPQEGEMRISGPRVDALMGSDVTVPWKEAVRYSNKKNGYHGGATHQEMLVPIGIWTVGEAPGQGWTPDLHLPPSWWAADTGQQATQENVPPVKGSTESQKELFPAAQETGWIDALLTSNVLLAQRERVGRVALDDARLRALLGCLDRHGDRANTEQLAAAINQPLLRIRGVLSIMQRMLNVDGYPVITIESATNTVMLNRSELRTQFEL